MDLLVQYDLKICFTKRKQHAFIEHSHSETDTHIQYPFNQFKVTQSDSLS